MLRTRLDLPLAQTVPGRLMPWLAGGLVCVVVVMLGIAVIADQVLLSLGERSRLVTVTLPLGDADGGDDRLTAALDVLQRDRSVIAATPVSSDELRLMMAPWLGIAAAGEAGVGDLPLPAMIDVTLDPLAEPDLVALERTLQQEVPGSSLVVDSESPGRAEQVARLLRNASGILLAVFLPAALAGFGAITVLSLRLCGEAIGLLRAMGASPDYLAGQWERYAMTGGLRGALVGLGLGLLTLIVVLWASGPMAIAAAVEIALRPLDWALLVGVAATSLVLAVAVVRGTAFWQLTRHP